MRLEKQAGKYVIISEYHERFLPKERGFDWNPETHLWETDSPVRASAFATFAEGELRDELLELQKQAKANIDGNAPVVDSERFYSPDGVSLYPFQKSGIAWLLGRNFSLLSDSMGCGKTIQAIGVINEDTTIENILIVCPASLRLNWRKELEHWLKEQRSIAIIDSKKGWMLGEVVIINYDILHKFRAELRSRKWDLLIVDEAHYCRNPKAKRTQELFGKKWRYSRKKEWEIPPIPAKRKILITGTPIVNRPVELWPLIHSLDPVNFPSYDAFTRRYCGARKGRWGWDVSGATNLEELRDLLKSTVMLRRRKEDVLEDLPPKTVQIIEIPPDGCGQVVRAEIEAFKRHEDAISELMISRELAKTYDSEEEYLDAVKRLKDGINMAFFQLATERKKVAMAKVPSVLEYLEGCDEKVVVFCHHRDVIHALVSKLKDRCVYLNGELPLKERQKAIDDFQGKDEVRFFIGSIQAAGVGITLTAARTALFVELDWVPGNMSQAESRIHRIGQKNTVLIQHLVFDNSIDARIAKKLVEKQDIISKALDSEVLIPMDSQPSTTHVSFRDIEDDALSMSEATKEAIRSALVYLSNKGRDFLNDFDKKILDNILAASYLSNKEAALGRQMILNNASFLEEEIIINLERE